jgi:hypothetical protein
MLAGAASESSGKQESGKNFAPAAERKPLAFTFFLHHSPVGTRKYF